ncbi:helix-turn-helix transcriptional regulator [Mesorhizobium sp. B2-3-4]|uniref:helix-turn-helix domain-containing protein n=1 Tax=Mesorhizobium sp. B2-3-4 TaxID=2589959 RepID=UPI001126CB84|nr:helix-turn-helix transcriptional regulator [Mesorhizobium sp. B2-3-4]TPM35555.1 helix-turn-helix transcriptional regulator [Mesorhizobium sp. B2-3-4]
MEPQKLIQMRRTAKLTQSQMAEALGFSLRGYQKLESGESPIEIRHTIAIEAILKEKAMNIQPTHVDAGIVIDANIHLTEALIKKLVNIGVIEKTDVADMLNDIIQTDKETNHPNAAGVEALLRKLFTPS